MTDLREGRQECGRRIVRQDGHDFWAAVSNLSMAGCNLDRELPPGEIVSVEVEDTALLIGMVHASAAGVSAVEFFRAASH